MSEFRRIKFLGQFWLWPARDKIVFGCDKLPSDFHLTLHFGFSSGKAEIHLTYEGTIKSRIGKHLRLVELPSSVFMAYLNKFGDQIATHLLATKEEVKLNSLEEESYQILMVADSDSIAKPVYDKIRKAFVSKKTLHLNFESPLMVEKHSKYDFSDTDKISQSVTEWHDSPEIFGIIHKEYTQFSLILKQDGKVFKSVEVEKIVNHFKILDEESVNNLEAKIIEAVNIYKNNDLVAYQNFKMLPVAITKQE